MDPLRWALVGTSDYAVEWIAPALDDAPGSSLAAVVSRDPVRADRFAHRLGARTHATTIAGLDPDDVDAVFIVTPNLTHAGLASEAARCGFDAVVEKPMAPSVEDCDRMITEAEQHGTRLAVAHCMAWTPPVVAARQLVRDGAIGELVGISIGIGFPNPPDGSWRQQDATTRGGGPLYDLGTHALDVVHRLLGVPTLATGLLDRVIHDYPAHDTATALLRHAGGAHTTVRTSFATTLNAFEVIGTEGRLVSEEWLGRELVGELRVVSHDGAEHGVPLERTNVYRDQAAHLARAFSTGEPTLIEATHGRDVVASVAAAVRAAESGSIQPIAGRTTRLG